MPSIKDFSIVKIVSRGAFGQVFLGYKNTDESKLFAIKVSFVQVKFLYGEIYNIDNCPILLFTIIQTNVGYEKVRNDQQKYGYTSCC